MSAVVEKLTVAIPEKELLRALWYDGADARLNVSEIPDVFEIEGIDLEMGEDGDSFVVFRIQRATNSP